MDGLVCPASSFNPPSSAPPYFFSAAGPHHEPVLEFLSCEVPEQWLVDDGVELDMHEEPRDDGANVSGDPPPALLAERRRRGRKPGPRTAGPAVSHVEAERQRRDKLNRRFCDLRAAVPTVSRMDKASLLADAVAYIAKLRARVEQLEVEAKQTKATSTAGGAASQYYSLGGAKESIGLDVRMVGREAAALRLTTTATMRHAPASFMAALRALDLPVQHASVCRAGGITVQDAIVDVPAAGMQGEGRLRATLLHRLKESA
ncbi:transcription factor bHLH14-like [Phragmites australis]|uniref:transcription factor bHLH14-like n=1 Tax=Phragmites australis TaxID=29695 RepID=UPI002D766068|nr:transcription factor bHLH14-like [Phragmites australis]